MVKYSYQGKTKNEQKKEKEYVKKICQSAQSRRNLHTHTHTGKLLPSLKQIGTICFTTILSLFISPSYSYITNSSGCNQGVLQTDTGPAALEANYSANTINTKWYSDGTRLTGAGIPSTCTYDVALSLPAAQTKPGYAFGGWKLRVVEPEPVIPTLATVDPSIDGSFSNEMEGNNWTATFSYGTVTGTSYQESGAPEGAYFSGEDMCMVNMSMGCCYCRITSFTPTGGTTQQIDNAHSFTNGEGRSGFGQPCSDYCSGIASDESMRRYVYESEFSE